MAEVVAEEEGGAAAAAAGEQGGPERGGEEVQPHQIQAPDVTGANVVGAEVLITARGLPKFREQAQLGIPSNVHMISGCRDFETSADVSNVAMLRESGRGDPGGACTNAFVGFMEERRTRGAAPSWADVLDNMRNKLSEFEFKQVPQLSFSREGDLEQRTFSVNHEAATETSPRRALLVGINYTGSEEQLAGCIHDVFAVRDFLVAHGYKEADIRIMVDDGKHEAPTLANMKEGFRWLVHDARPDSSLFVHFSGHGTQVSDRNGDEKDGQDETILPVDFRSADGGIITDDFLYRELVLPLPKDAHMTCLFDCCHSGSILDLPFTVPPRSSSREVTINDKFEFSTLVRIGKEKVDEGDEGVTGGLANLTSLVKGIAGAPPIL